MCDRYRRRIEDAAGCEQGWKNLGFGEKCLDF